MIELIDKGNRVFLASAPVVCLGSEELAFLRGQAFRSPRRRARICAHQSDSEPLHEMFIALCRESYIPPHRHLKKSESFHWVEGRADVVLFNTIGQPSRIIRLDSPERGGNLFYRLSESIYHTLIIHSDVLVIHETTNGPFTPGQSENASFAPAATDEKACAAYQNSLRDFIFAKSL